jgi:hypothetical protein
MPHITLPADTPCPFTMDDEFPENHGLMRREGREPSFAVRKGKGAEMKRCASCGKNHFPSHFMGVNPEVYELMQKELERLRNDEANSESDTEDDIPENTVVEVSDKNPRKPYSYEDYKAAQMSVCAEKLAYRDACDKVAKAYQATVDTSDYRPSGSEKVSLKSSSFRTQLWKLHNGPAEKALCPCCKQNEISSDEFHAGHIHPESRMGDNSMQNIIPVCSVCNLKMGSMHMFYYAWVTWKNAMWTSYLA